MLDTLVNVIGLASRNAPSFDNQKLCGNRLSVVLLPGLPVSNTSNVVIDQTMEPPRVYRWKRSQLLKPLKAGALVHFPLAFFS